MRFLTLFILLLLPLFTFGIAIKEETNGIKVYLTQDIKEADLVVYIDDQFRNPQREEIWRFVIENPDTLVKFVPTKEKSEVVVFYTKNKRETGWKKDHPLIGSLVEKKPIS